ncbi:hypothetical protein RHGRI_033482 [Rhododendron griersonianum]|uniref:Jacalin-type lectin domain-containing protein n=1 Tax=Rhododendron griersonianum TaxID=479676 RepID=A0AAV6I178_9ERIC|nr:hypothetical protein RHGRI_033482 [Rhododendron griersonianum]
MGKISGEKGWISLGPWGGKGGKDWAYKPDGPIMKITIWYRDFISQILFESKSSDGVFCIDNSVEQLSSISLTYDGIVIKSLCLETNIGNKYGPFGWRTGPCYMSIPIEGGVIIGFHGRAAGSNLGAIGIFVAPKGNSLPSSEKNVNSLCSIQDPDSTPTQPKVMVPEAIAIVMAPTDTTRSYGIFRLSDPGGMNILKVCQETGYHPHREPADGSPIYEHCSNV